MDKKTDVELGGKKYLVSTVNILNSVPEREKICIKAMVDCIFETMVFPYRADGAVDMGELYCERYKTMIKAVKRHNEIVKALQRGELWG